MPASMSSFRIDVAEKRAIRFNRNLTKETYRLSIKTCWQMHEREGMRVYALTRAHSQMHKHKHTHRALRQSDRFVQKLNSTGNVSLTTNRGTHTRINTHTCTHTRTHKQTSAHARANAQTLTPTRIRIHAFVPHIHTHKHIRIHILCLTHIRSHVLHICITYTHAHDAITHSQVLYYMPTFACITHMCYIHTFASSIPHTHIRTYYAHVLHTHTHTHALPISLKFSDVY